MHVSRVGFTPLKGARHVARPFADLTPGGPAGDRVFCLVDTARCRVIDLDGETGERRTDALRALAAYRREGDALVFGVDAVVTKPGRVRVGDTVGIAGTGPD